MSLPPIAVAREQQQVHVQEGWAERKNGAASPARGTFWLVVLSVGVVLALMLGLFSAVQLRYVTSSSGGVKVSVPLEATSVTVKTLHVTEAINFGTKSNYKIQVVEAKSARHGLADMSTTGGLSIDSPVTFQSPMRTQSDVTFGATLVAGASGG